MILILGCVNNNNSISTVPNKQGSLNKLKEKLIDTSYNYDSIKINILNLKNDSLKNQLIFDISYHYLQNNDSLKFRFWNKNTLKVSEILNDSSKIAESYWDLASFYYEQNITDSSYLYYNKAFKFYDDLGDNLKSSNMLLNMAILQKDIKDYVGSEITTVSAIKKIKPLQLNDQLYTGYNILGILNNELKEYDKSLIFHKKALKYQEEIGNSILKATSYNNIGVVLRNMKKFDKSLRYFDKALEIDSIFYKNPRLYAMLLDNSAYSKFKLGDTLNLEQVFLKALGIRDSISHESGKIVSHLHLGEYLLYNQDTLKGLEQIQLAKKLSEEFHSYGDLMESLLFLAKIDTHNSNQYLSEYISLNDSLQNEERSIRNKFARIRFETDEFIAENEVLVQKNFWIITGAVIILILSLLVYIIKIEKGRNRKLILNQKQQIANEEIYNLLLDSQKKLEEGKENEKKRISKELHDGILSKFFGVRLNLELLNNSTSVESIKSREKYIFELKQLENEIRNVSHQLNNDMFSTENSFKKIIEELLTAQRYIGKFNYLLEFDETISWEDVTSKIKINIYRILQEAIHNINKYSEAKSVEIIFLKINNKIKVNLKDNGIGFDTNLNYSGIGHQNMKSRIMDLSGEIQIKSSNSGTEIIMYIPLNQN